MCNPVRLEEKTWHQQTTHGYQVWEVCVSLFSLWGFVLFGGFLFVLLGFSSWFWGFFFWLVGWFLVCFLVVCWFFKIDLVYTDIRNIYFSVLIMWGGLRRKTSYFLQTNCSLWFSKSLLTTTKIFSSTFCLQDRLLLRKKVLLYFHLCIRVLTPQFAKAVLTMHHQEDLASFPEVHFSSFPD